MKTFDFTAAFDTYDDKAKDRWHREAKKAMKDLAHELGLAPGSYDIHSNKAGPACSGEVTLHGENCYIMVGRDQHAMGLGLLFRSCKGRKDCTGGGNQWTGLAGLSDIPALARTIRRGIPGVGK